MRLMLREVVCHRILAVRVAAALATAASAQGNIRTVTFYTVKPDRIGDFQAEIKQYNAVLAKGGSTRYNSVWLSLTGPRTYVRVDYYKTWADLDAAAMPDPKMKDLDTDSGSNRHADHRLHGELAQDYRRGNSGSEPAGQREDIDDDSGIGDAGARR